MFLDQFTWLDRRQALQRVAVGMIMEDLFEVAEDRHYRQFLPLLLHSGLPF